MLRCAKCVMPLNLRPDTPTIDGVCGACVNAEKKAQIDWASREEELHGLLEMYGGNGSGFDCIVPSSGGKDSSAQVLAMLELGVRPLVVTASTCMLSEVGRANIDNLARYATTVEFTPNRTVRAKLNKIALNMVGDASWPQHASIFSIPFRAAVHFGIPLIMYGECPQMEYAGPEGTEAAKAMTRRWVQEFGGLLAMRPSDFVGMDGITEEDMADYLLPSQAELDSVGVHAAFLGYYRRWDSLKNGQVANQAGMRQIWPGPSNLWLHENQDCLLTTPGHDALGMYKFGYSRGVAQISIDIRNGRATREQGLRWIDAYEGLFPLESLGVPLDAVLKRMNTSRREYLDAVNQFLNRDIWVEQEVAWGQRLTLKP